jgi:hypothetical protein
MRKQLDHMSGTLGYSWVDKRRRLPETRWNRTWFSLLMAIGATLFSVAHPTAARPENVVSLRQMREWTVVVGDNAIPSEKFAADEFCRLFKAATGAEVKPAASPNGKGAIFIGECPALRAHPLGFGVESLGEEGLRIRIASDVVLIAGGRPRGTLYGVYEFFERYLGVRFLTTDHTHIPGGAADMVIPTGDYQYVPLFSFRFSYYQENLRDPGFAARLRVNTIASAEARFGGKTRQELISHSIATYLPAGVYGQEHPEYFALFNGVRKLDNRGGGPQVCSVNPEVIRIVSEAVERALDADPTLKNISVSQMDNSDFCQCPACSALSVAEGTTMAPHLGLVNAVADRIATRHPHVKVGTLAYDYTRKPPKTMKARPNVEIMLCSIECCTLHPLNDPTCARNRTFCRELADWKDRCDNIWIWNYNTNFRGYDLPFPNFNAIAKNVQFFLDNHVRGVFMQAAGDGLSSEMSDLRNYVMARCLWRPTDDGWALVDEFCRLHYGPAASPILAYERYLHQNAEARRVHPECFPVEGELGLNAEVAQRIQPYFKAALKLAPDDTIRRRVEKATIPALRTLLSMTPLVYTNALYRLDAAALGTDTLDRYVALCEQFGMNMVGEGLPAKAYFEELEELRKGVPAVLLENQVWRIILLPQHNGRIVEMTDKKTGRNLVAAPTRGFNRWHSHEEWMQTGLPPSGLAAFTCETSPRSVKLNKTLPDGSVWHRTVSLKSDTAENIEFQTEFTAGATQVGTELHVHPEYYTVTASEDPTVIALYVKDGKWTHANRNWRWNETLVPDKGCPKVGDGAFAYYNHTEHFGVQQTFNPSEFGRLSMYWSPGRQQVGLEMFTPVARMAKGQKLTFSYAVSYLQAPPIARE